MSNSSRAHLPSKPHDEFPLYVHKSDRWAKKVRGKTRFFGKATSDADGKLALAEWERQREYLLRDEEPPAKDAAGLTLGELRDAFLRSKRTKTQIGKLSPRTLIGYKRATDVLTEAFGPGRLVESLRPGDFDKLAVTMQDKHGSATLGREITMVRSVFKFGYTQDLIDKPIKFGENLVAPSASEKRGQKQKRELERGKRVFTAGDIRAMTDAAGPQLKAMIYLGINCGFGNTDCASLPIKALDLDAGFVEFPRPKTNIQRRIPLWPQTVAALRDVLAKRPEAADKAHEGLVFLTRLGKPWVRFAIEETKNDEGKMVVKEKSDDAIAKATGRLLRDLNIYRSGVTFYSLRHTFETIGGGSKDQVAVNGIMGHADASMAETYRHGIEDARLLAVVDHVRRWLFPTEHSQICSDTPTQALRIVG